MTTTSGKDQPPGVPPEQIRSWLEAVQEQVRRIDARIVELHAELARLQEQESLLSELLASASPESG